VSAFLLELAFGPVQGFINAARRSRDLWAGSHLLSEVARAAGKSLLADGAELIYPLRSRVLEERDHESSNLSNVLLARIADCDAARAASVVARAQQAARDWLGSTACAAWDDWTRAGVALRKVIWTAQVDDALETYGAWAEETDAGYREAYDRVKSALAARKNTRDFAPMFPAGMPHPGVGVPKSSLDGLRESVLPAERGGFPARFGVSPGEQLDALGCVKRVHGLQERFTALTRLAADGWLGSLPAEDLQRLCAAYTPLTAHGLATGAKGNAGLYAPFAFDGGLLFPERLEQALGQADAASRPALQALKLLLAELYRRHGQPCPYAVLVVADGDRMGRFIDQAGSAEAHTRISQAVAAFADEVPNLARAHRGHCVFNGGEDLTVLYPLAGAVEGARALSAAFERHMQRVVAELPSLDEAARPTLRVGAAICHVLEPLGVIRGHGDAAEKYAKGEAGSDAQGDALGLSVHVRAGHQVRLRLGFGDKDGFDALARWRAAYADGALGGGLVYAIRDALLRCRRLGVDPPVVAQEVRRVLVAARERGGTDAIDKSMIEAIETRAATLATRHPTEALWRLTDELIIARWLSANTAADVGSRDSVS